MKKVYSPQLVLAILLVISPLAARAVVGPVPDDTSGSAAPTPTPVKSPPATPTVAPAKKAQPSVKTVAVVDKPSSPQIDKPTPTPTRTHVESDGGSVDRIKGVGKYVFGAKLTDFSPAELQPVDPRAKGKLLRVSPYGNNYLVTNLTGLTWGNIPLSGLIVTFHEGILIDIQMSMRGKKVDFYLAERAFREKYGPNDTKIFPVETWSGEKIQVTLIMVGAVFSDPGSLDKPALGKVEMFDKARWSKFAAADKVKLDQMLDQRYKDSINKVKSNL